MNEINIIKLLEVIHDELMYGSQTETFIAEEVFLLIKKLKTYYKFDD